MNLIFDWDAQKAESNLKKHSISFTEAKTIFNDPVLLTFFDEFHSKTETRYISIGYSSVGRILLVVHTEEERNEGTLIRIISSRKATAKERKIYGRPTE